MRCPNLQELPPPPVGKTGWPWTVGSPFLSDFQPDGTPWPTISIVTPSFNQAETIEETIRSILLQGYPNLEYIVMDGGSTHIVTDIIEKYRPWLSHYESGPDGGQAAGINKGLRLATGALVNWVNSDDFLQPRALHKIATSYALTRAELLVGQRVFRNSHGDYFTQQNWQSHWDAFAFGFADFPQEATFFSRDLFQRLGGLSPEMVYMFDTEFYNRCLKSVDHVACISADISIMTINADIKTLRIDERKLRERAIVQDSLPKALSSKLFQLFKRLRVSAAYVRLMQAIGVGKPIYRVSFNVNTETWDAEKLIMP